MPVLSLFERYAISYWIINFSRLLLIEKFRDELRERCHHNIQISLRWRHLTVYLYMTVQLTD